MPDNKPIVLSAPGGNVIKAEASLNSQYPGIVVTHVLPNGEEAAAVLLEYSPTEKRVMLRAWSAEDPDGDPVLVREMSGVIEPDGEDGNE